MKMNTNTPSAIKSNPSFTPSSQSRPTDAPQATQRSTAKEGNAAWHNQPSNESKNPKL
jgi:hypothetical protein